MSDKKKHLTKEGFKNLKEKYQNLRNKIFKEENSDDKLFMLRQEAERLKKVLKNAKLIKKTSGKKEVDIGTTVKVKQSDQIDEFEIVDSVEANPAEGKISEESLVGRALVGRKIGDTVTVQSHIKITYEIIDIK